jgi:hypothetical protein
MNHFTKKGISILLAVVIIGGGLVSFPKQTTAFSVVEIGPNVFQNTISAIKNVESVLKEWVLDNLANSLAKAAISSITNSIVNWINSGFEGSPAFVTDLHSLLRDVGDKVFEDFISQLDAGSQSLLCSPFSLDVKLAVTVDYFKSDLEENRCSLDNVLASAQGFDRFVSGNFAEGGWKGWFDLTTKRSNNPYGSFLDTRSALQVQLGSAKAQLKEEVSWGDGFLSSKDCATVGANTRYIDVVNAIGSRNPGVPISQQGNEICAIKTPGKVIEQQLEHVLGSGVRQLELADEFNEIVSALIAQLSQQVLTGAGGLLGTSNASAAGSSGGQSFIDRLGLEQQQATQNVVSTGAVAQVQNVIDQEQNYLDLQQQALNSTLTAETALAQLASCPAEAGFVATSQATINNTQTTLQNNISQSQSAISALTGIRTRAASATGTSLTSILGEVQTLQSNGTVHTQQQVVAASTQSSNIQNQMSSITTQAQTRLAACTP